MKKLLLSLTAIAAMASAAQAQQRMILYEEFTGENCPPCASSNPTLDALMNANPTKVFKIQYQSPIPSAGPIYNTYQADYLNRGPYYSVPFAPYGREDGKVLGTGSNPGHVAYMTQAEINTEYAINSAFNMNVTHAWNATGDTVTATIVVTCVTAFAPASAQMKLRVALVENLHYASAPGTNGEVDFPNAVRRMYPDGTGTTIANAWTLGQTQTYVIKGFVPSYVDKSVAAGTRIVAWLQNDNDKIVAQAGISAPVALALDVASSSLNTGAGLVCAAGTASLSTATVTIKNTGATTLTTAKVYYKVDAGAWQMQPWSGSLAANATTNVSLPAISLTPGSHIIYDSVAGPNNAVDVNTGNNVGSQMVNVQNTTANALPIATGFESAGAIPANWTFYDLDGNQKNWMYPGTLVTGVTGHTSSAYAAMHFNFNYTAGETNLILMPTPTIPAGDKALDFYYAYAQYAAENDKLEVVYSTNCGQSWTSIWSRVGSALSTTNNGMPGPAVGNNVIFKPTAQQWRLASVDLASVPTGAIVAFRAVSDYGNNLYIDDINMRTGKPTGIEEVVASGMVTVYPNPAKDNATVEFTLNEATDVQVQVLDATGRVISNVSNGNLTAGVHKLNISTAAMASGLYNVRIQTEKGSRIERLSVVK